MLRIKFGAREWFFDESAQFTMGEMVMLREMGTSALEFGQYLVSMDGRDPASLTDVEASEFGEALAKVAFLAEVRQNHDARWRDFIWTITDDDLATAEFEVVAEPANRAERRVAPAAAEGVGAALAAAQKAPAKKPPARKPPAKRATTRKSPRAAARTS